MIQNLVWAVEFATYGAIAQNYTCGQPPPQDDPSILVFEVGVWGWDAALQWSRLWSVVPDRPVPTIHADGGGGWYAAVGWDLPAGYYRVRLSLPIVQPLQLTAQGYLSAEALENALDRQAMMLNMVQGLTA